jgi:hypothetical protein
MQTAMVAQRHASDKPAWLTVASILLRRPGEPDLKIGVYFAAVTASATLMVPS